MRGLQLQRAQLVKLNLCEERMLFDAVDPALHVAEPLGPVCLQKLPNAVPRVRVHLLGEPDAALEDLLVQDHRVLIEKGRPPHQELVQQHPHRPPVHRRPVPLAANDLWRHVLWRAAERPRPVQHHLGEAEVCDLDVAVAVEEEVLGLEVAVGDHLPVQVLQTKHNLGCVISTGGQVESLFGSQESEDVSALRELQDHVHTPRVLECAVDLNKVRVPEAHDHDCLLVDDVLDLLILHDLVLAKFLDCVPRHCLFVFA
mmetsp:Transcript_50509/g.100836  ORF Transcript_50509/g.100836 Transcript_50509/m.100836 type:complete len:257 (-) Transcript_50509:258-1028(-)